MARSDLLNKYYSRTFNYKKFKHAQICFHNQKDAMFICSADAHYHVRVREAWVSLTPETFNNNYNNNNTTESLANEQDVHILALLYFNTNKKNA